jgi:hypothetical protein
MKTFSNIIITEQNDGMGAEGLSKARLKTMIYKATKKCTHNKLYKDTGWNGPQCIWNAFDKLRLNWTMTGAEYHTEKNPSKSMTYQMPTRKEWSFEIKWENDKKKYLTIKGHVTAAGAGSVDNPLERYDVNMVIY